MTRTRSPFDWREDFKQQKGVPSGSHLPGATRGPSEVLHVTSDTRQVSPTWVAGEARAVTTTWITRPTQHLPLGG